jgi:hypothetical protein
MSFDRLPVNDPRTVSRDIPGIFDAIFPQLVPGIVAYFNRQTREIADCQPVSNKIINESKLSKAMLFEIAYSLAEYILSDTGKVDWDHCLQVASDRQRRYYDADIPKHLTEIDKKIADAVAKNLITALRQIHNNDLEEIIASPQIPGYQWIASGHGDFSCGNKLIEVKCTGKHFSASDYRQIIMYWLLSFAKSIETDSPEWATGILLNPRMNYITEVNFNEIIAVIGSGRSKIDILELFSSMVSEHTFSKSMTI